jgi:hypothetical protein
MADLFSASTGRCVINLTLVYRPGFAPLALRCSVLPYLTRLSEHD